MIETIKFIHTADIHLGKKLSYNSSNNVQIDENLSDATEEAFKNLVKLAVDKKIDFILISGDLYDRESRSVKSSRFFLEQAEYLADNNIEIYIISGNHDPAGVENEVFTLPQNVKYFSSEQVETIEFKKEGKIAARILGQSYRQKFENRTMYNYYTVSDDSVFNIALLHTALNKDNSRYVPVNKSELLTKSNIHYWALGHIHQYQKIHQKPSINFSGTLQAHDISEEGIKGAILVEVDPNLNIKEKFIPLAPVIFKEIKINLEEKKELTNITELELLIKDELDLLLEEIRTKNSKQNFQIKGVITRLNIEGRTKIHQYTADNRAELEESLLKNIRSEFSQKTPSIWPHSVILRTAAPLENLEELKQNNQLYQEMDRLIMDLLSDQKLKNELISEWGQIWQGDENPEDRENFKFNADHKLQKEILTEAEKIIVSELIEGGD